MRPSATSSCSCDDDDASRGPVYGALCEAAARWPSHPFLNVLPETAGVYGIDAGEITYAAMLAQTDHQARPARAAGVGQGMRIGVLVENRPSFFRHWFAMNALGASIVPINPDLRAAELEYLIGHSEMSAAIVLPERAEEVMRAAEAAGRTLTVIAPKRDWPRLAEMRARPIPPPAATPNARCSTPPGTTGRPKGCVLTNTYYLNNGRWYGSVGGLVQIRPGRERMLTPLPLFHMKNAMATSTMAMMLSGGCLTILDRFHPRTWWDSVRASRATIVHYLGVMPPMLMGAPAAPSDRDNKVVFGFGAGVNKTLHGPFETFGFPLVEAWAMTETGGGVIIAATTEPRHLGVACIGKADGNTELRIIREDGTDCAVDKPGKPLVRRAGPNPRHGFVREYLKDPEATEAAWAGGYFNTGDVVRRDSDGCIYFVDRRKNVIRRSGENIAAVEVESVLLQHPDVAACAVAATPDAVRGDEVFACIVARNRPDNAPAARALAGHRAPYLVAPRLLQGARLGGLGQSLPVTATQNPAGRAEGVLRRDPPAADPAGPSTRAP